MDPGVKFAGTFLQELKKMINGFSFIQSVCHGKMFSDSTVTTLTDALMHVLKWLVVFLVFTRVRRGPCWCTK